MLLRLPSAAHIRPWVLQIDVATFTARHQSQLTVRNDGKAPVSTLLLCEPNMAHVATLEVWAPAGRREGGVGCWSGAPLPLPPLPSPPLPLLRSANLLPVPSSRI
jgi:hypothetical protein